MNRVADNGKPVGNFIWTNCECGQHLIDLYGEEWNDKKLGFYKCTKCEKPLVCRGDDGHFYIVGERMG